MSQPSPSNGLTEGGQTEGSCSPLTGFVMKNGWPARYKGHSTDRGRCPCHRPLRKPWARIGCSNGLSGAQEDFIDVKGAL